MLPLGTVNEEARSGARVASVFVSFPVVLGRDAVWGEWRERQLRLMRLAQRDAYMRSVSVNVDAA